MLAGVVEPRLQPLLLLVRADVEVDLDDAGGVACQQFLEVADVLQPPLGCLVVDHVVDAGDEHVFVLAAVEDADIALGGRFLVDAPQEIVAEFLGAGLLEAGDLHARWVEGADDLFDGPVLARRVARLQDEQQRLLALGVEPLLPLGKLAGKFGGLRLPLFLGQTGVVVRRPVAEFDPFAGLDAVVVNVHVGECSGRGPPRA